MAGIEPPSYFPQMTRYLRRESVFPAKVTVLTRFVDDLLEVHLRSRREKLVVSRERLGIIPRRRVSQTLLRRPGFFCARPPK
jgi:hypothetical protein